MSSLSIFTEFRSYGEIVLYVIFDLLSAFNCYFISLSVFLLLIPLNDIAHSPNWPFWDNISFSSSISSIGDILKPSWYQLFYLFDSWSNYLFITFQNAFFKCLYGFLCPYIGAVTYHLLRFYGIIYYLNDKNLFMQVRKLFPVVYN